MYLAPAVCTSTLYSLLFVTITSGYLLLFNYCILKGLCHKLAISQGLNVFFLLQSLNRVVRTFRKFDC